MMREEIAVLPARPGSVAEWEDLLVRLEIAPRAARLSIEELEDAESAARALETATLREAGIGRLLEIAARLPEPARRLDDRDAPTREPAALSLRFASLRARTFALVQRRGLEVWDWEVPLDDGVSVTVFQLLQWLAGRDARLLAELRATSGAGWSRC